MIIHRTISVAMLSACLWLVSCSPSAPAAAGSSLLVSSQQKAWDSDQGNGLEITTQHYRIYTTASNPPLLHCLPGYMEAAHRAYLDLTGQDDLPGDAGRVVYLMGTRSEWANLTQARMGDLAKIYKSIEAGGYCHQGVCVFWDMGGLATLGTASHEGLHQFLSYRMKHRLPMWLEEGLCASMEGYDLRNDTVAFTPRQNAMRYNDLRTAIISGHWIPLDKLLPMDASDAISRGTVEAVGYYGQLWALSLFLRESPQYRAGLRHLLADAQAGRLNVALNVPPEAMDQLQLHGQIYNQTASEPIFRHYISNDLARFEAQYKLFATQLVDIR